jgi:2-hydroxychromene-2-carboxylate isomerase
VRACAARVVSASRARVVHYFDYKSPYAFLAQEATFALAGPRVELVLVPYTLDIPAFLGRAEVDAEGRVLSEDRNAHQWRRVRYIYMDCRREARKRGLVLRGPRKVYDSRLAHAGFLYAQRGGGARAYHDDVFARFWRHELDLEDPAQIADALARAGVEPGGFAAWAAGEGLEALERLRLEAEARGVFGVPSYLVGDELFWGNERLEQVRERLAAAAGRT